MATAPLRLGYLVPQFPGQTHIFFWREIAELERRGVRVHLMSTRPPPAGLIAHSWSEAAMARTDYLGRINLLNALRALPRLPLAALRRHPEPRAFWRDVLLAAPAALRLVETARRHGLDHVHVHSCARAALVAALSRAMGGPGYSLTLHGPLSDYGPGQRYKWSNAAFATVITEKLIGEVRAALAGSLPERILCQPMGVDTDALARPAPYEPPVPGGPLRLFSCGRLNPVKGHQDLMQAVAHLRAGGRDVRLDIAGEDDAGGSGYHGVLAARIAELGLSDHVRLLGAIDAEAVRRGLLAADVFVLASHAEPLGVAYMEAMACGVPTIGTDAGGVPELITDGVHGLLAPPQDPRALAGTIARLADDPALARRLSDAGRARVVERFRAGIGAETLVAAIEGGIDARNASGTGGAGAHSGTASA